MCVEDLLMCGEDTISSGRLEHFRGKRGHLLRWRWLRGGSPLNTQVALSPLALKYHDGVHIQEAKQAFVGPERSRVQELLPIHRRTTLIFRLTIRVGEGLAVRIAHRPPHVL